MTVSLHRSRDAPTARGRRRQGRRIDLYGRATSRSPRLTSGRVPGGRGTRVRTAQSRSDDCLVHPADRCVEGGGAGPAPPACDESALRAARRGRARHPRRHVSDQCSRRTRFTAWMKANDVPADADIPFRAGGLSRATCSFTLHGDRPRRATTAIRGSSLLRRRPRFDRRPPLAPTGFAGRSQTTTLTLSDITGGAWGDAEAWTIKPSCKIGDPDALNADANREACDQAHASLS